MSAASSVGQGTYGTVYPYAGGGHEKCIKVLHRVNCDSAFHQMAFSSYVRDLAALEGDLEFVKRHLVLPEQLVSLKDGRRGILMDLHYQDLYTEVSRMGPIVSRQLRDMHDALCDAVGWLNDRQIYFSDISRGTRCTVLTDGGVSPTPICGGAASWTTTRIASACGRRRCC